MVKNDSLITYEKAFEGQAAGKKCSPATFLERKIMSTKTTIKRIALVAASALAIGGFSAVSANAADGNTGWVTTYSQIKCAVSIDNNTGEDCSGLTGAGNQVVVKVEVADLTAGDVVTVKLTGSATIRGIDELTVAPDAESITISADRKEASIIATGGAGDDINISLNSVTAGDTTIQVSTLGSTSSIASTLDKGVVTFIDSAGLALSSTQTNFGVYDAANGDAWACGDGANSAEEQSKLAVYAKSSVRYDWTDSDRQICVVPRNALGAKISVATGIISVSGGSLDGTQYKRAYTWAAAGKKDIRIDGDGLTYGDISITVTLIDDDGNTVTKTGKVSAYGDPKTYALTPVQGAGAYGSTTYNIDANGDAVFADYAGGDKQNIFAAAITAKDKNSVAVGSAFLSKATEGDTDLEVAYISSAVPGVTLKRGVQSSNGAVVTTNTTTDAAVPTYGLFINCENSQTAEKLTIRVYAKDLSLATPDWVSSNEWTYYCSDSVDKVTVVPSATTADAGTSLTAQVSVVDANGFPAPDNTSVTMIASNGAGIATPSTKTNAGALALPANILVGSTGPIQISATAGGKTGSAVIEVAGGSGDNASLALDAANAATDAANNAYDEAQNATQAASDALAAIYFFSFATAAVSFLTLAIRDLT